MKEQLYTIPVKESFEKTDECPFCTILRKLEQDSLDFVLGVSYMESDFREKTDEVGFCKEHFKMMYDYGNTLGNAWILSSHFKRLRTELHTHMQHFSPEKASFMNKFKKNKTADVSANNPISAWIQKEESHCYICDTIAEREARYLDTFFYLLRNDKEFVELVKHSKGFCIHHFGKLMEDADANLNAKEKEWFYPMVFQLMDENLERVEEDVRWLIEKYDYRNKDADWKNSKDAIPRTMKKITGGDPSELPYVSSK